jgi:hypothetical protein
LTDFIAAIPSARFLGIPQNSPLEWRDKVAYRHNVPWWRHKHPDAALAGLFLVEVGMAGKRKRNGRRADQI